MRPCLLAHRKAVKAVLLIRQRVVAMCRSRTNPRALGTRRFWSSGELEGFLAVELGLADEFVDAVGEGLGSVAGGGGLAREGGTDEERDFAPDGFFFEGSGEFGESSAAKFFVDFGDFAGEAGGSVAEDFAGVGDGFGDAVGCFVEDKRAVFDAKAFEGAAAFAGPSGEKADEEKFFVGQAGGGKSGEER